MMREGWHKSPRIVAPADWATHIAALEKALTDAELIGAAEIAARLRQIIDAMNLRGMREWPEYGRP